MIGANVHQELLLVERSCQVLGTDASINLAVPPGELIEACAAMEDCLAWLKVAEQRLSLSNPASELCQLNARAGHWQPVSDLLLDVVQEALCQAQASAGLFDPTPGSYLETPGNDRAFSPPADGWREVQLDAKQRQIYLPTGTWLDLAGIAKGWAADVVGNQFLHPFANVLVNVGGNLLLRGRKTRYELWTAGLRASKSQPFVGHTTERAAITLRRGGLATEGAIRSEWPHQSQWQPVRGASQEQAPSPWDVPEEAVPNEIKSSSFIATATALARTAAHAEVAALVALQRGYPEALDVVESAWRDDKASRPHLPVDHNVALLLVLNNGEVMFSENMEAYLERFAGGEKR